ncbi:MAG: T9SS type A sorting domain-containing protein [Bacteroidetes bacterium]|nr:MAG: T9SS type A sorting domain-containing protein [Bacteroidota bacterium]
MRKSVFTIVGFFLFVLAINDLHAGWIQKSDFGGVGRMNAAIFTVGAKAYIGTGSSYAGPVVYYNDFWEWDQATDTWTQKATFAGIARSGAVGFVLGTKGYLGTGFSPLSYLKDFWEYDPTLNTWTQKADFGGTARSLATGFSIGTKGYLGTGVSTTGAKKDFWEYDPSSDTWLQKADFGGVARSAAVGFSIGVSGYIAMSSSTATDDLWEYNTTLNAWFKKADFPGAPRGWCVGFAIGAIAYVGLGNAGKDLWQWDQTTNTWTPSVGFVSKRGEAVGFSIGTKGYVVTGSNTVNAPKDFWELDPACSLTVTGSATTICAGTGVNVSLNSAFSPSGGNMVYSWSPAAGINNASIANPMASPTFSTTYLLTATDVTTQCSATSAYSISAAPLVKFNGSHPVCSGQTTNICAFGAVGYLWNTGQNTSCITISPTTTTSYSITVWDVNGCNASGLTTVTVNCAGNSNCNNRDFENGNFQNWNALSGSNTGNSVLSWTGGLYSKGNDAPLTNSPQSAAQHTILTINKLDSLCIDPSTGLQDVFMSALAPGGGNYSVRLGNGQAGCQAEALRIPFSVTASDTVFTYQYACVFQEPGHVQAQQTGLMVNVFDQNNNLIPSLSDTVYCGDPQYAFITSQFVPVGNYKYKRWSGVSLDLSPYGGSNVTIEFANFDCGLCGHFAYTYLDASCFGSPIANIWPGDCDYDLNSNNVDLISLGIAYGATGSARSGATNNWVAQPSSDWNKAFPLGANYKHSDCNGDGVINASDTVAISLNYGNTHPFRLQPKKITPYNTDLPDIYLVPSMDTANPSQMVDIDIMLGKANKPVDSIYGIAFRLYYDSAYINSSAMGATYNISWMGTVGTNMITMNRNFYSQGQIDFALTRINQVNIGGSGKIATLSLKVKNGTTSSVPLNFYLADVVAVTKTKNAVSLNVSDTVVIVTPTATGVFDWNISDAIEIYPNPAQNTVSVNSVLPGTTTYEIFNSLGQRLSFMSSDKDVNKVDISNLKNGVYQFRISNSGVEVVKKLYVVR